MKESSVNRTSFKIDMLQLKVCVIIDDNWRKYIADGILVGEEKIVFLETKENMSACNFMKGDTAYIALDTKCSREIFLHE